MGIFFACGLTVVLVILYLRNIGRCEELMRVLLSIVGRWQGVRPESVGLLRTFMPPVYCCAPMMIWGGLNMRSGEVPGGAPFFVFCSSFLLAMLLILWRWHRE